MEKTIKSMVNTVINGVTEHKSKFNTDFIKQANNTISEIKDNGPYNIQSFELLKPLLFTVLTTIK